MEIRKFLGDNSTLPNYLKQNRNYQNQRNIIEENTLNKPYMKSFPYNQLTNLKNEPQQRLLNDSASSNSSSSQVITPSTSDCSEIILVPTTTTTSTINTTSPSSLSSSNQSDCDARKQFSDTDTGSCRFDNSTISRQSRMHFLRSSAV